MYHVSERLGTSIRLAPDTLKRVRAMADEETEGNVSAMLRKLLREALVARDRRGRAS
jgi:hypothetical protein